MNLDYLKDSYHLNRTEVQVLAYLDEQINLNNEINIRQVAKECFSSPASIIRLAKKLNFSGYNELLYKMRESHLPSPIVSEGLPTTEKIEQFCHLMNNNKNELIIILGNDFSNHISSYISEVLNFHYVPNVTTAHTQMINSRNNQNILFFIISHSGEEEFLKKTIQLSKRGDNTIISFLGNKNNEIARASNLVFSTNTYSPFSTNIAQPQLFFGRTLITFEYLICSYINSKLN